MINGADGEHGGRHYDGFEPRSFEYGGFERGGTESGGAARDGRVRWSARLPAADDGALLALPDGGCLVSTAAFVGLARSGTCGVLVEKEITHHTPPVLLPGGGFARAEDGVVVVRDLATGAVLAERPEPVVSALAAAPDGGLIYVRWTWQDGNALVKIAADGAFGWARPLTRRIAEPPVVTGGQIVVGDGSFVRSYSMDGEPLWFADADGLRHGPGPAAAVYPDDEVRDLGLLAENLFVADLRRRSGSGRYVFDVGRGLVRRLEPSIATHRPMVAVPGRGLAIMGPTTGIPERPISRVALIDAVGAPRWTHDVSASPRMLLAVPGGDVAILSSPSLQRWERYHRWYDLSRECFVRRVAGSSGEERSTWTAPAPLTYHPAIDPVGDMYVATPGRLWALF